jgi:hypothetical protein
MALRCAAVVFCCGHSKIWQLGSCTVGKNGVQLQQRNGVVGTATGELAGAVHTPCRKPVLRGFISSH